MGCKLFGCLVMSTFGSGEESTGKMSAASLGFSGGGGYVLETRVCELHLYWFVVFCADHSFLRCVRFAHHSNDSK